MFGPHLMVDAYGCKPSCLEDLEGLTQALLELTHLLRLVPRRAPHVYRFAGDSADDWGISGLLSFQGSRLTIHTFPTKSFFSLDFCPAPSDLDARLIQDFLRDRFGAIRLELHPLRPQSR